MELVCFSPFILDMGTRTPIKRFAIFLGDISSPLAWKKLIPSKQSQQTKIPSGNLSHSYWTNGHRNISCSHSTLWFSVMSTFTRGYTTWIHIEPPCFLGSFLIGTPGLGTLHRAQCGLNEALGQVEPWAPGYSERIDSEWSHCRDWAYVCRILWRRSVMGVYVMYVWDIYIYIIIG